MICIRTLFVRVALAAALAAATALAGAAVTSHHAASAGHARVTAAAAGPFGLIDCC